MASTASSSSSDPAPNPTPNKPSPSCSFIRPSRSHPPLFLSSSAAARGIPTRPTMSDRVVTVANPAGYIRNANPTAVMTLTQTQDQAQAQSRPYVFTDGAHAMRPPAQQQQQQFVVPRQMGGGAAQKNGAATAHPKVVTFPISSTPENKNSNDRDKNREDTVVVMHDRKVRLSEGSSGSLYSLCRSWVRNGLPQDVQPTVGDGLQLLPKPLPESMVNSRIIKQSADANGGENSDKEDADSVEQLSAQDLLKRHIKHAKNVRAQVIQLSKIHENMRAFSPLLEPDAKRSNTELCDAIYNIFRT